MVAKRYSNSPKLAVQVDNEELEKKLTAINMIVKEVSEWEAKQEWPEF